MIFQKSCFHRIDPGLAAMLPLLCQKTIYLIQKFQHQVFTAMKKIFLILFLIPFFFACKDDKDKDPAPELSAQVAGTYKVSKLAVDGESYPLDLVEILIQLDKSAPEAVTGEMRLKIDGEAEPDSDLGTLNLKNVGSMGIDVYEGTTKVGNIKSDVLTLFVEFEGQNFEMVANKR
jgi:hypothetical protein